MKRLKVYNCTLRVCGRKRTITQSGYTVREVRRTLEADIRKFKADARILRVEYSYTV